MSDPRGQKLAWSDASPEALVNRLDDPRPAVRKRAIEALAQRGEAAIPALRATMQALLQTCADIAKAKGLTMVLNKAMVVLNVASYDITKEALQKLDAKLASVKLPPPQ